jgi:hypothetical protein
MVLRIWFSRTTGWQEYLGQRRQHGSKVRDDGMVLRSEATGWFLGQRRQVVLRSETIGWFLGQRRQDGS